MALQTGLHPAQLKDSVTSESMEKTLVHMTAPMLTTDPLQPLEDYSRWKMVK
jgi:hypothetical protein